MAHFNERDQAYMMRIEFLVAENTKLRITPQQGKQTSTQHDIEETIDELWDVVEERIINTEAARVQTTNVNQQTNLDAS